MASSTGVSAYLVAMAHIGHEQCHLAFLVGVKCLLLLLLWLAARRLGRLQAAAAAAAGWQRTIRGGSAEDHQVAHVPKKRAGGCRRAHAWAQASPKEHAAPLAHCLHLVLDIGMSIGLRSCGSCDRSLRRPCRGCRRGGCNSRPLSLHWRIGCHSGSCRTHFAYAIGRSGHGMLPPPCCRCRCRASEALD